MRHHSAEAKPKDSRKLPVAGIAAVALLSTVLSACGPENNKNAAAPTASSGIDTSPTATAPVTPGASESASASPSASETATTPEIGSKEAALQAIDNIEAEFKAIYSSIKTKDDARQFKDYYDSTDIARLTVTDEAFRAEYGICGAELTAAQYTNDTYRKVVGDFLPKSLKGNKVFNEAEKRRFMFDMYRADQLDAVIAYLQTVVPQEKSLKACVSPNMNLTTKDPEITGAYIDDDKGNHIVSVSDFSPFSVVPRNLEYASLPHGKNFAVEMFIGHKFPDGSYTCAADYYYATISGTNGLPPTKFGTDFEETALSTKPVIKGDWYAQLADIKYRDFILKNYLAEKALYMLPNVCAELGQ